MSNAWYVCIPVQKDILKEGQVGRQEVVQGQARQSVKYQVRRWCGSNVY